MAQECRATSLYSTIWIEEKTAMKTFVIAVAALAALTGCATQRPAYYTTARVQDPYQWHTVSVLPSGSQAQSGTWTEELPPQPQQQSRVVYSTEPAYSASTVYVTQPAYYAPAPVYYAPAPSYYYPPVSIGLDFSFGRWCCGGGRGWGGRGWGGYHRR
jgi:predicted small lipoprotein YifL